jgi:hypothetical protein
VPEIKVDKPAIPNPLGIDDSAKSEPIRWPSGKPLPKPGDRDWLADDPFAAYVDATTGEPLN